VKSKSVVNISVSSPRSEYLNSEVKRLVDSGLTVVVSAGNSGLDANGFSPASEPSAITVAASTNLDEVWGNSNFGSAIGIYAPGGEIVSADIPRPPEHPGNNNFWTRSGTSPAAPHVSGLAACIISRTGFTGGPAEVRAQITAEGIEGKILRVYEGTENLLANNGVAQKN